MQGKADHKAAVFAHLCILFTVPCHSTLHVHHSHFQISPETWKCEARIKPNRADLAPGTYRHKLLYLPVPAHVTFCCAPIDRLRVNEFTNYVFCLLFSIQGARNCRHTSERGICLITMWLEHNSDGLLAARLFGKVTWCSIDNRASIHPVER
ncbi:uncharacterized protein EDB91DRAFT_1107521 [Suillus paluster]|uniref:uncharacterized protein n=1 Tax=Suillus paluster TaxID=48578 RepID=UPI001B86E379|nr:uncharacterized protein EDB91DRAFT_1107521 [Suillus paluster]KAG1750448.1 hypothetical protein EDB91DRAFT_1107521 [Suillus paluster]